MAALTPALAPAVVTRTGRFTRELAANVPADGLSPSTRSVVRTRVTLP